MIVAYRDTRLLCLPGFAIAAAAGNIGISNRGIVRKGPSSSSSQRDYRNSGHDDKPESSTLGRSTESTPYRCPSFLSRLLLCFKPSCNKRAFEASSGRPSFVPPCKCRIRFLDYRTIHDLPDNHYVNTTQPCEL